MDTSISSINQSAFRNPAKESMLSNASDTPDLISFEMNRNNKVSDTIDVTAKLLDSTSHYSDRNYKFEYRYWYVILLTINASMGNFFIGWGVGVFDPIQINLVKMFNWTEDEEKIYLSFISASLHLGAILGAVFSGWLSKKYGRRKALIYTNILSFVGTALTLILNEFTLIAGRFISGICVGFYSTVVTIYVNEFTPYEITGLCGTIYELIYSSGIFLCYLAGLNLPEEDEPQDEWWRVMVAIPGILNVINMLCLLFIFKMDTPKNLYINEKNEDEAKKSLRTIYKREEDVEEIIKDYRKLLDSQSSEVHMKDLFTKKYRLRLFIACVLMVGQQIGGADVIFMYSDHIYIQIVNDKKNS